MISVITIKLLLKLNYNNFNKLIIKIGLTHFDYTLDRKYVVQQ